MMKIAFVLSLVATGAAADTSRITGASVAKTGGTYTFNVTLKHPDTGWDHYADGWRVLTADGTVLGTRELLHPHVDEQPFTRSLSGITVPDGTADVRIQTRCNVDGWSDTFHMLKLN